MILFQVQIVIWPKCHENVVHRNRGESFYVIKPFVSQIRKD